MRYFDAATIRARLPWARMREALAAMLIAEVEAPLRTHHAIDVPGAAPRRSCSCRRGVPGGASA